MKKVTLVALFLFALLNAMAQQPEKPLKKIWETGGFNVPESVLFDSVSGKVFVSNIAGKPAEKDSIGYISTLTPEGKILNLKWAEGLNAPKGMGIYKRHLYVTDIDEIAEISLDSARILARYPVAGARFLNDIAVDESSGMIFATETAEGRVYVLHNGQVNLWLEGDLFKGANGLYLRDSILYIGTSNSVMQADIHTGEVVIWMINTGEIDGLYALPDGRMLYSNWKGAVFTAVRRKKPEVVLNTTDDKINAADFGILRSKNQILIPTFAAGTVSCYALPSVK
jgi:DNA-binding beta-propeller fold protein YncE